MTTQTSSLPKASQSTQTSLLKRALFGNATFSGVSGLILLLAARPLASFMGVANPGILSILGGVLVLYAPFLVWLANRNPIPRLLVWMVIELDVLWVIGSAVLIFSSLGQITTGGKWALAIVADIVAVFAVVQYIGLRRMKS